MSADLRGLLLCAGSATRFGGDKLLAVARGGAEAIAVRAARNLIAGVGNATAVIRPGDDGLRRVLEAAGCSVIESMRSRDGMGYSLGDAVAHTREAAGWIVALGDMPSIDPRTIERVRQQLELGALIAAPVDASGQRGHPVGFGSTLRDALLALQGDVGARLVISHHHDEVVPVVVDDPGIFIDIDTLTDLLSAE
jgi:molybdenum cofactor cytidylyltransferase